MLKLYCHNRRFFLCIFSFICTFLLFENYLRYLGNYFAAGFPVLVLEIRNPEASVNMVESHKSPLIQWFETTARSFEFEHGDCPVHCEFRGGNVLLEEADAVVFRWPFRENITSLKKTRRERQIWVFTFTESPHIPEYSYFPNPEVYNWTMTYRRDSDVDDHHYGNFRLKEGISISPEMLQGLSNHSISIPPEKMEYYKKKFLKGKTKLMAWTSSHNNCVSIGGRERMVKILDDVLGVDKYGGCGSFECKTKGFQGNFKSCYREQGAIYKFYLAFENSICMDYVSEKFYTPLRNRMIPIVYGGANYTLFGPLGSFIDSLAFPTVHELIEHLIWLDKNPEEYLKYFLWTDYYEVCFPSETKIGQWCDLCQKLWNISVFDAEKGRRFIDPHYRKIHKNVSNWWAYQTGDDDEEESNPCSKWLPICQPKPTLIF